MTMNITIPGKPIPKARARILKNGNSYDPQKAEKEQWQWQVKLQLARNFKVFTTPLLLKLSFIMPIPKAIKFTQEGISWHSKKPDLDNLIKFVKDCGNKLVWEDDSQVCYISAMKYYGLEPKTEIDIEEI